MLRQELQPENARILVAEGVSLESSCATVGRQDSDLGTGHDWGMQPVQKVLQIDGSRYRVAEASCRR